ncbi:MAG TPA: hypothetical protein VGZ27_04290 [Vicinamibacterales bacterium]|nr:hypothetical protein [Vicinamibacterales bacterium]
MTSRFAQRGLLLGLPIPRVRVMRMRGILAKITTVLLIELI